MGKKQTNQGISTRYNPSVRSEYSTAGITLVALVVTIVVLIILAVISINVVFREGGILDKPKDATEKYKEAELRERLELVRTGWITERAIWKEIDEKNFFNMLIKEKIIIDMEDVKGPTEIEGNKIYEITTTEGYIVEITVNEKGNIIIGEIEKGDNLAPKIVKIEKVNVTKSSFTVKANVLRSKEIKYFYKLKSAQDSAYMEITNITGEGATQSENLVEGETYTIKVEATNETGTTSTTIDILAKDFVAITGMTLSQTSVAMLKGREKEITVTIEPENATEQNPELIWTITDEEIATISGTGLTGKITSSATKLGQTTITVKLKDDSNIKAECSLKVIEEVYGTSIESSYSTLYSGSAESSVTSKGSSGENYYKGNFAYPRGLISGTTRSYLLGYSANEYGLSMSTGLKDYPLDVISDKYRWIWLQLGNGRQANGGFQELNLGFSDGSFMTIVEAVEKGYIEPLVISTSTRDVNKYMYSSMMNLLSGGYSGNASGGTVSAYAYGIIIFKLKDITLKSIRVNALSPRQWDDGLYVYQLPEDWYISTESW